MAINLAIDDALLEAARRVGGLRTKKATVTGALNEYIQRRKQQQVVGLFGKIDLDPKYDCKAQRRLHRGCFAVSRLTRLGSRCRVLLGDHAH